MSGRWRAAAGLALCWLVGVAGNAQTSQQAGASQAEAAPSPRGGGFESRVELSLGAVFVDTDGSRDKFWTDRYLRSGFNTAGLLLDLRPLKGTRARFDSLRLTAAGIGDANPYQQASLRMVKRKLYDLKAGYHKYNYFFALPEFALGLHTENSVGRSGNVNLKLFPGRKISLSAGYRRHQLFGTRFSSQNLILDTYPVSYPRRLASDEFTGGVEVNWKPLLLSFDQSFTRFRDDSQVLANANQPEGLRGNLLEAGRRDAPTRIATPVSRVLARYAGGRRYELVGRYLYSGADLRINRFEDLLQRTGVNRFPVRQIIASSGTSEKPTHNAGLAQTWEITDRLKLEHRFTYETYTLTGLLDTTGFLRLISEATGQQLDLPFQGLGGTVTGYRLGRNETELEYSVASTLSLVGGHRYSDRHLAFGEYGASARPVVTVTNAGSGGVLWVPGSKGRVRVEMEKGTSSQAFNRIDPLSFLRWRIRGQVRPVSRLTISGSAVIEDNSNDTAGVNHDLDNRQFGAQVVYVPSGRLVVGGGYNFYRLRTSTDIVFYALTSLTGGISLYETNTHVANFHLQAPVGKRVDVRAGYEYVRDTGASYPLRMRTPRAGVSVLLRKGVYFEADWTRYAYHEEAFAIRNYRANVLRTGLRFIH